MDLLLLLVILIIPAVAQWGVYKSYNTYKQVKNSKGISGFEVARKILDDNGLEKVHVVEVNGNLTDHYDPSRKVVRLSSDVFHGETIAAVSIAAHEVGHALQDKDGYLYMRFRSLIFPVVNVATGVSYYIILLGILLQAFDMIMLGIALTGCGLIFQLVTLPVEFNASNRAKKLLTKMNLVSAGEAEGVRSMLGAAAMTYVAGVIASALQILRLLMIYGGNRD